MRSIAEIIVNNPEWKRIFPNVVPDTDRGWSNAGFSVKDVSMTLDEWSKRRSASIDPTLLGGGYESRRIIGKHPTGVLIIDDIHDLNNSLSERERARVVDTLKKTILKTVMRENDQLITWIVAVGTPWAQDDAYYVMRDSGQFSFISVPAMVKAPPGAPGATYLDGVNLNGKVYEDIVGWWFLEWPDRMGPKSIVAERSFGMASFWQMIMLDLTISRNAGLRFFTYDHTKVHPDWPRSGGCDFATLTEDKPDPGRDKFSRCDVTKTPMNQIVVTGGILEQCTQAQAEQHLLNAPDGHRNWRFGIFEGDGAGEQFFLSMVRRIPGLQWRMQKTGGKAKRYRQERELGPWLENGQVLISDEQTPYLVALRKALDDFPDGNNDVRDGLYWAALTFPECLVMPDGPMTSNEPIQIDVFNRQPARSGNPWANIGVS